MRRMMLGCFAVAAFLILESRMPLHASTDPWVRIIAETRPSLLLLRYPKSPEAICTGWVYGPSRRLLVTARHCVIDEEGFWDTRVGSTDSALQLKLVQDWPDDDLAVLEPMLPVVFKARGLELAGSAPKMGQAVMALGYPGLFGEVAAMFGWITHPDIQFLGHRAMVTYGGYIGGISGSPIVDLRGRVVGVATTTASSKNVDFGGGVPWRVLQQLPKD